METDNYLSTVGDPFESGLQIPTSVEDSLFDFFDIQNNNLQSSDFDNLQILHSLNVDQQLQRTPVFQPKNSVQTTTELLVYPQIVEVSPVTIIRGQGSPFEIFIHTGTEFNFGKCSLTDERIVQENKSVNANEFSIVRMNTGHVCKECKSCAASPIIHFNRRSLYDHEKRMYTFEGNYSRCSSSNLHDYGDKVKHDPHLKLRITILGRTFESNAFKLTARSCQSKKRRKNSSQESVEKSLLCVQNTEIVQNVASFPQLRRENLQQLSKEQIRNIIALCESELLLRNIKLQAERRYARRVYRTLKSHEETAVWGNHFQELLKNTEGFVSYRYQFPENDPSIFISISEFTTHELAKNSNSIAKFWILSNRDFGDLSPVFKLLCKGCVNVPEIL